MHACDRGKRAQVIRFFYILKGRQGNILFNKAGLTFKDIKHEHILMERGRL